MYIKVAYKDLPELSTARRQSSDSDSSMEKILLINPECYVRIMLEYIRRTCRLGVFTQFDLCDENGILKGLFKVPTYTYATDYFDHARTYYIIVFKQESDKRLSLIPQLNWQNKLYTDLKVRVKTFMSSDGSGMTGSSSRTVTNNKLGKKK